MLGMAVQGILVTCMPSCLPSSHLYVGVTYGLYIAVYWGVVAPGGWADRVLHSGAVVGMSLRLLHLDADN